MTIDLSELRRTAGYAGADEDRQAILEAVTEIESLRAQLTAATTERDSWESRTHTAAWESIELKRRAEAAEQALAAATTELDAAHSEGALGQLHGYYEAEIVRVRNEGRAAEKALQRVRAAAEREHELAKATHRDNDFAAGRWATSSIVLAALGAVDTPHPSQAENRSGGSLRPMTDPYRGALVDLEQLRADEVLIGIHGDKAAIHRVLMQLTPIAEEIKFRRDVRSELDFDALEEVDYMGGAVDTPTDKEQR